MVVMHRKQAWDEDFRLKRDRRGSCPKNEHLWGEGWLFPCS